MTKLIIKTVFLMLFPLSITFGQADTTGASEFPLQDSGFVMQKSPWGAVLRSAVLPGWGQFYNESYFKIPVIWGISAWLLVNWFDNDKSYRFYRDLFASSGLERHRTMRTFYRDQRDLFSIYIGILYFLNLVDAYVDAHLFDFSVDENLMNGSPMIGIKFNF